jgi:hypothetical protein
MVQAVAIYGSGSGQIWFRQWPAHVWMSFSPMGAEPPLKKEKYLLKIYFLPIVVNTK